MPAYSVVGLSATGNIKPLYWRGWGERGLETSQTIILNCGMTHSPGKIEYNCRYFIMSFRKKKFCKNDFQTLQGTVFHRPLTNSSSLKITAAYCTIYKEAEHSSGLFKSEKQWMTIKKFGN
jgi:hypothetical protein